MKGHEAQEFTVRDERETDECKRMVKVLVADASSLSLKFSSRFFVSLLLLPVVHHQHVLDNHSQMTHRCASFSFCLSTTACSLPILRHRRSQQLRETNTHTRVSASRFPLRATTHLTFRRLAIRLSSHHKDQRRQQLLAESDGDSIGPAVQTF